MKKQFIGFMIMIFTMQLVGCASVQRKFIRKKKEPQHVHAAIYYEPVGYQKKFSNAYYYKTHFMFWRSWQADLIEDLKSGNQKRMNRSAQESFSHLTQMNQYLKPEKQTELKPMIDSLADAKQKIEGGRVSSSSESILRGDLEKIRRVVSNDFYYDKVKEDVLPDNVDLGNPIK